MAAKTGERAKKTGKRGRKARKTAAPRPDPDAAISELIDMQEAIKLLKTTRPTFYRWLRAGKIKGMKLGRQWRFYREDIDRFLKGQGPRVDLPASLKPLIKTLRQRVREQGGNDPSSDDQNDVQRVVRLMVALGVVLRASDLHMTAHIPAPGAECVGVFRCRVDGVLHPFAEIDLRLLPAIIEEWKRMAACDVRETKLPQDGRIVAKLPPVKGARKERTLDLRVCFVPAALGESVTVRLLDPANVSLTLDRLDYTPRDRERLLRALGAQSGLIVVTGPTGCGKTTILYCCVSRLAGPGIKAMSAEDPVEYFLPWVTQIPVRHAAGLTFPRVLRSMLRSDPDVILIGEIRNLETLSVAQQAVLTGHMVMTSLHTNDAAGALTRMVDMGSSPFLVADTTRLVTSQRLVRVLCPHCSAKAEPPAELLDWARDAALAGGLDPAGLPGNFKKAVGCERCASTGYKGRTLIAEMLEVSPKIRDAVFRGGSTEELRTIAVTEGMTTLVADGVRRAAEGQTTLAEVARVAR